MKKQTTLLRRVGTQPRRKMRGKLAKAIRRYVRETHQFLSATPGYQREYEGGTVTLDPRCQRQLVQKMKRNYIKRRYYGHG